MNDEVTADDDDDDNYGISKNDYVCVVQHCMYDVVGWCWKISFTMMTAVVRVAEHTHTTAAFIFSFTTSSFYSMVM